MDQELKGGRTPQSGSSGHSPSYPGKRAQNWGISSQCHASIAGDRVRLRNGHASLAVERCYEFPEFGGYWGSIDEGAFCPARHLDEFQLTTQSGEKSISPAFLR